jgi:hypothetical protein
MNTRKVSARLLSAPGYPTLASFEESAASISYLSWKASALLLSPRPDYRAVSGPASNLSRQKHLDQLLNPFDHDDWWSVFESLRARQIPRCERAPQGRASAERHSKLGERRQNLARKYAFGLSKHYRASLRGAVGLGSCELLLDPFSIVGAGAADCGRLASWADSIAFWRTATRCGSHSAEVPIARENLDEPATGRTWGSLIFLRQGWTYAGD